MTTKFIADSSCDLWTLEGVDFTSVPLTLSTDEISFVDDETLNTTEMLDNFASYKGRSYSACPNIDAWLHSFGEADRIYVVTMTSTLSGTYNSAMAAQKIYLASHPNAEIHIFDSLSTGPEMRLLLEKLVELHTAGLSFEDVCREASSYLTHTRLFFALKSLHNMAQNGRVSKAVAAAVGVLGISIFATASTEGTVEPISKCRSEKKVISTMVNHLESAGFQGGRVRINHVENLDLATKVQDAILAKYPQADILIYPAHGLCCHYAERGGIMVGCECV